MKNPDSKRPEELGPFITEKRAAKRMKEMDLAKATSLSTRYIGLIEKGIIVPTVQRLKRIAKVLGFDVEPFYEAVGEAPPPTSMTVTRMNLNTFVKGEETEMGTDFDTDPLHPKNPKEKRRHSRLSVDFVTTCRVENEQYFFTTVNVSQCGMGILLTKTYPVHAQMKLTLKTGGHKIEMIGKLIWIKPGDRPGVYRGGIEIIEITPENRALYEKIINQEIQVDEI